MAEKSKNVNTSQNKASIFMVFQEKIANQHREAGEDKASIFMVFPEKIANQHREAVLKFQDN